MKPLLTLGLGIISLATQAQLTVQSGATLFIDAGASVTVQGDLVSNANITGTGKIIMKGTALQNLNMNGFTIPNLDIDNTNNVALGGETKVSGVLSFVNGKLQLGNYNFVLAGSGSYAGAGAGKFAETNGTGEFRDEVSAVGSVTLPVGVGADYNPVTFQLAGNTFSSAWVGARAVSGGHPAKHPRSSDFLNHYWALSQSGVSGGTITTSGTYVDGADVTGTESFLNAMTYNGSAWSLGTSVDNGTNTVTAPMSGASSQLYAMNKFIVLNSKAFLQAPFNSGTGLMNDQLRSTDVTQTPGTPSSNNIIPTTDPYRAAPLSSFFTHTSNIDQEVVAASVFNHQANPNDNIVDWVFLELRNTATSGNQILQTRAALLQRDGDIVDIDGVSPVYFKNIDAASFSIGIRHRNHIGIYTNPSNFTQALGLNALGSPLDISSMAASNLMGGVNAAYFNNGSKNMLFAGNANMNNRVSYSGSGNDASYILSTFLGGSTAGIVNGYSVGDLNFNRNVRYSGSGNDASFLLSTPLTSGTGTIRTEVKPN